MRQITIIQPKSKFGILKLIYFQGIHINDVNLNWDYKTWKFVGFYVRNQIAS